MDNWTLIFFGVITVAVVILVFYVAQAMQHLTRVLQKVEHSIDAAQKTVNTINSVVAGVVPVTTGLTNFLTRISTFLNVLTAPKEDESTHKKKKSDK